MEQINTLLKDVQIIKSPAFFDERGGFIKLFNQQAPILEQYEIKQVNFVQNKQKGIIRGLHYQTGTFAESKFFRVLTGRIQLAFVDLRQAPFNHQKASTFILDSPDIGVLVPRGFATGYLTLEENTDVLYYSDNVYEPSAEQGLRWNDPLFKIQWLTFQPNLSQKDKAWANFATTI
ncbi:MULTISPECIES: dTDP-4-dehydrorhamnose 3,5-epimerase family protein [unclassified Aureispira]|uniref:dTDP-4-dehydrorhamnose 3,5-epimerase family protein n=1 Tax=unclassified Aureispira TaxID=2649989 RepID=UPI0006977C7E|nr:MULTISPECIES: dTDP-4-dehydrorhamnose 3,5-epimerase [unclassified Aureispira]WMX15760.1 dTDP-4-dehydrorhamnose 3,5-epimerase [Aureispira sp. CCB-E]